MKYATEGFIVMALLLLFGIIGSMERLPEDAEQRFALERQGKEYKFELAAGL